MKKGVFITLEGNEGCGKSTQIQRLARYLKKKGRRVFVTREPGGTRLGEAIRAVLLNPVHERMSARCETLLYMASRAALTEEVVLPNLKKGIVICDRWLDSTVAYQGYARGLDVKWIRALGREATQGLVPDLTLYLDLPVAVGLKRTAKKHALDRIERKGRAYHERVRQGFLRVARLEPRRFKRLALSPGETIEAVHVRIRKEVDRVLRRY